MNTRIALRICIATIAIALIATALSAALFIAKATSGGPAPEPTPTSSICPDAAEVLDAAAKGLIAASAPVILDGQSADAARAEFLAAVGAYERAYFGAAQECRDHENGSER